MCVELEDGLISELLAKVLLLLNIDSSQVTNVCGNDRLSYDRDAKLQLITHLNATHYWHTYMKNALAYPYNYVHVRGNCCIFQRLPSSQHRLIGDCERTGDKLINTCIHWSSIYLTFAPLWSNWINHLNKYNCGVNFNCANWIKIYWFYYLCRRWQALNVSRRVRNATGCWDMLLLSDWVSLLLEIEFN